MHDQQNIKKNLERIVLKNVPRGDKQNLQYDLNAGRNLMPISC